MIKTAIPAQGATTGEEGFTAGGAKESATRRRIWRGSTLWALLGSISLGALYGRVALFNLTTALVGGYTDGYENLWDNYWVKTALLDLHTSPFYTNYIYYPTGISLRFHTLNPFNGIITMPFNMILGYLPTTNLFFVFALSITVFFAFLLLRDLTGNSWAAFGGAATYTFAHQYLIGFFASGQSEKLSAEWLPLYLLFVLRALYGKPVWKDGELTDRDLRRWPLYVALSILTLFILSLTDWQYLMYAVLITLLYGAFLLLTHRSWREKWRLLSRLAIIGAAYTAIAFPLLVFPMITEAAANGWLVVTDQSRLHSVDIADFLGPGLGNPGYLAIAVSLVGIASLLRGERNQRELATFWGVAWLAFFVMALGPGLIVNGQQTGFALPYSIFQDLPVFDVGRDPRRFYSVDMLVFGIFTAFGLKALIDYLRLHPRWKGVDFRWGKGKLPVALMTVVFLTVTLAGFVQASGNATADKPEWPPFYNSLAGDKESYAILELPSFTQKGKGENTHMAYQTLHNKPIFGGRWARDHKLSNPNNFMKTSSLFHELFLVDYPQDQQTLYYPKQDFLARTDYSTQGVPILNYYNVRYIVLYKDAITPQERLLYDSTLARVFGAGAKPYYEDNLMWVYRVPESPPPANPLTLDVGTGWFVSAVGQEGYINRWADSTDGQPSELYSMNLTKAPLRAELDFTAYTYKRARTLNVAVNGRNIAAIQLKPEEGARAYSVEVEMPPGNNIITFSSPEAPIRVDAPHDSRPLSFGMYSVRLTQKK